MTQPIISKAMLMCAGLGTRLAPFTEIRTKALMPIMGVPIAQFSIDSLIAAGVSRIVANVHHRAEETQRLLKGLDHPNADLLISDESKLLLGSGGALIKALPQIGHAPFFFSNADVLCNVDWQALAEHHQKLRAQHRVELTLTIFPAGPKDGAYREVLYDSSNLITGLGQVVTGKPFFVGAAVIEPEALAAVPSEGPADFILTILEPAIRKRKAGVFLSDGYWFDIGSPQLWLNTHLSIMEILEQSGKTDARIEGWKKRIQKLNQRVGDRLWVSNSNHQKQIQARKGPAYWGASSKDSEVGFIPKVLGPNAVLYDSFPDQGEFTSGVGFGGNWVPVSPSS
jgi:MurNAc alpha-1-phosphate uridylyltransferase